MIKIYLFPKVIDSENPYMAELEKTLSPFYDIVNKKPNKYGVINLFKYLFRADIFYLNWIENIPVRRFGRFQYFLFLLFLIMMKCLKKSMIWTLHNKKSHETINYRWTNSLFRIMFKYSDLIITHSQAGVEYAEKEFPRYAGKVSYITHPVKNIFFPSSENAKVYDLIIWGTIWPYKGIVEFLRFVHVSSGFSRYKVLIVGQCLDKEYNKQIEKLLTKNIIYLNDFCEMDQVAQYVHKSRFVLFTYNPESILSSSSLMDTIGMGAHVIGPHISAFKDLSHLSFVHTYRSFNDILEILDSNEMNSYVSLNDIQEFFNYNNWETLGVKLNELISTKLNIIN